MRHLGNLILNTDSYKASHWLQYPPDTEATFFYVESRGGQFDRTLFFGLQAILKEYLASPITHDEVAEAREFFAAHGEPFNEAGWRHIVTMHGGRLPLRIRAVPEGAVVPTQQALVTIESTDPAAFWLPSYVETLLLRLWYPVTVATIGWQVKQTIRAFLEQTSDDVAAQLPFKLHDFGARGVSSAESAALGGMAHLVNFQGTDTVLGVLAARRYYGAPMAGFSIPAAEHSTITSWGQAHEVEAFRHMLARFAKPGSLLAVVSDSYDIYRAIREHWGHSLREEVIRSGATLVVRPDSGDPVETVTQCLYLLDQAFGSTTNSKGYKVLKHVRLIQGDGVTPHSIRAILERATTLGYATDNLAFGMGGALLQQVNRDTQKFAMKCSAACIAGQWVDVYKSPITDPDKLSKRGRLTLLRHRERGDYQTVTVPPEIERIEHMRLPAGWEHAMHTVWENGTSLKDWHFDEVRTRSASP